MFLQVLQLHYLPAVTLPTYYVTFLLTLKVTTTTHSTVAEMWSPSFSHLVFRPPIQGRHRRSVQGTIWFRTTCPPDTSLWRTIFTTGKIETVKPLDLTLERIGMATRACAIATLASLPPEMVLNILSYLDTKDAVSAWRWVSCGETLCVHKISSGRKPVFSLGYQNMSLKSTFRTESAAQAWLICSWLPEDRGYTSQETVESVSRVRENSIQELLHYFVF